MTQAVYTWNGTGGSPGPWRSVEHPTSIAIRAFHGGNAASLTLGYDRDKHLKWKRQDAKGIAAVPDLVDALALVKGMLWTWETRGDDANDAQAAFDAFIGAEDAAEIWAKVKLVLKDVGVTGYERS